MGIIMHAKQRAYLSLVVWIAIVLTAGGGLGSLTKSEINTWYTTLNQSALTPPNYVFPIAWTILYSMLGASGWLIWQEVFVAKRNVIKTIYISSLILNLSWTPLFFHYHLTGLALIALGAMDILALTIIYLTYQKMKTVSFFMTVYLAWILFASYLNFYIWQYN